MSEAFIGEIRIVGFPFAPMGWALCNGQTLQISQNQALYSLLGITYGGDGRTTFNLPNLQARVPVGMGQGKEMTVTLGQQLGEAAHTLTATEMPAHTHAVSASTDAPAAESPAGALWTAQSLTGYADHADGTMAAAAVTVTGQGQAHPNLQPYQTMYYIIATQGIYPTRN